MPRLIPCRRCQGGQMVRDEDRFGTCLVCLSCGHWIDLYTRKDALLIQQPVYPPVGRQREGLRIGEVKL